jgi:O-acetylserine/cysteine efflux transporter
MDSGWTHRRWSVAGLSLTLLAAALWGLAPVATKAALQGFSPELIGCLRLAIAALLFRMMAGEGARWFVADPWVWTAGVALGVDFIFYNYGLQRTSANVAGLVINVEMVSTIAFAVWLLGERLTAHRVVGSIVTLAGVLVVTLNGLGISAFADAGRTIGNLMVMTAGVAWSLFAVAQRRAHERYNLFQRLTPIFAVAAMTTAPTLLHRGAWVITGGLMPTLMLVILIVLGTNVVYWIYARAQQLIDVSVLAVLLCSIPVFAVVFAYALLGEPLTRRLAGGGALVVAGIVVIALEKGAAPEVASAWEEELESAPATSGTTPLRSRRAT